jgi:uncharacterized membrane protein
MSHHVGMMDAEILVKTLSSLHPALIHFPIGLLLTAAFFDAGCLVFRSHLWLDRTATSLMVLGTIGLGAAYLSGERAAEAAAPVTGAAQGVLADHEDLALLTLGAWAAATALKLFVSWLGRHDLEVQLGIFRLAALVLVFGAAALLVLTAFYGGQLVFDHGVGVGPAGG